MFVYYTWNSDLFFSLIKYFTRIPFPMFVVYHFAQIQSSSLVSSKHFLFFLLHGITISAFGCQSFYTSFTSPFFFTPNLHLEFHSKFLKILWPLRPYTRTCSAKVLFRIHSNVFKINKKVQVSRFVQD